jgi:hypothetical protein
MVCGGRMCRSSVQVRAYVIALTSSLVFGLTAAASAQTQVVRSTGPGVWGADTRLVEEIRIGRLEGAEEYLFGRVGSIAVGREGLIYVADTQGPIIRRFDARGQFLRNIGGVGSGPGEYRAIGGLRMLADGRLAIWDPRQGRIGVYTAEGAIQASHVVPSGLFSDNTFQTDAEGRFYIRTILGARMGDPNREEGWIRVAATGRILDTLRIPRDPRPESFVLQTASGTDRPFTTELVTRLSSLGYLITGRNDRYAFDLHLAADRVVRIERAHSPVRLGRDERNEWQEWARFFERRIAGDKPANPNMPSPRRVTFTIPEVKPAFSEILTDSQGRVWVRRYVQAQRRPARTRPADADVPEHVWREPPTFDVFEPAGRFLGTVTLPWNAMFYDAHDRLIWATVRGDMDETYVVRFRIESGKR